MALPHIGLFLKCVWFFILAELFIIFFVFLVTPNNRVTGCILRIKITEFIGVSVILGFVATILKV